MRFIRKIKRENDRKKQRKVAHKKRLKGLKYNHVSGDWEPVKIPVVGHNRRRKIILEKRKLAK